MNNHEHHHHHHHLVHAKDRQGSRDSVSLNAVYIFSMVINLLFVLVETGMGFFAGSLGLLSDAGHNLGDVFSLLLAFVAFRLSSSRSTKRFTYGYKKTSVLISLLNAIILLVAVGAIVIESVHKFRHPEPVNGSLIAWTAGVGIIVNGVTAIMLSRQSKHDINTRGAFLHMLADTLVSVGVLLSGVIIQVTGFVMIDPIIGLIVALVILTTTWNLLSESLRMSIDAVPENIDIDQVRSVMESVNGISRVHHLHIWSISTTEVALTAHLHADNADAVKILKQSLQSLGITHSTIETETDECHCGECGV